MDFYSVIYIFGMPTDIAGVQSKFQIDHVWILGVSLIWNNSRIIVMNENDNDGMDDEDTFVDMTTSLVDLHHDHNSSRHQSQCGG